MAAPLRRDRLSRGFAAALAALVALPLAWIAAAAVRAGLDGPAWQALMADPQTGRAMALSAWTGLAATALSVAVAAMLLSRGFPGPGWARLVRSLPPLLATPHAAFAIGLAFLLAPSGWLLRALSPWATGLDAPPPWPTTQDPWGLGLIAALVAKEVPFLLWAAATQLQRDDVSRRWSRELDLARSLGYAPNRAWWRVVWPQLWPRLAGPLLAVMAYSLTVVDMALVIGPAAPPTLSVLAWQWLLDADPAVNAQGAAAAWTLAALVGACALVLHAARRHLPRRQCRTDGARGHSSARVGAARPLGPAVLVGLYLGVFAALAVGSVSGVWPFPRLWPETLSLEAWTSVANSARTVGLSLGLGLASAFAALAWSVAWMECAPARWDTALRRLLALPLLLPSVLWVLGLHGLTLALGLDAHWAGLWMAHALAALPYVLLSLSPAYQGFDPRHAQIAASLGHGRLGFLWQVKWPLLRSALAHAAAVGFAVSIAQYLPTLFVGAGRYATVTTEAVTLASGAQRSLTAAYAGLLWLLPAMAFALAAWAGRPRRFAAGRMAPAGAEAA